LMDDMIKTPGFLIGLSDGSCCACLDVGTELVKNRHNLCLPHRYILWVLDSMVPQTKYELFRGMWANRKPKHHRRETDALGAALDHMVRKGLAAKYPKGGYLRTPKGAKLLLMNAPPAMKRPNPVAGRPKSFRVGTRVTFQVNEEVICTVLPQVLRSYMPAVFKCDEDGMHYIVQHECVQETDCDGTNPVHTHLLLRIASP